MFKVQSLIATIAFVSMANIAHADNTNILLGGAIGGIAGAAIGHSVGGKTGAIVGAGLGGAAGASIGAGSSQHQPHYNTPVRYEEHPGRGHAYGHRNQWRENEHRQNYDRHDDRRDHDGGHRRH